MTINEFNRTKFYGGMFATYQAKEYLIISVDFCESLIALQGYDILTGNPYFWARCENVEIAPQDGLA